MLQKQFAAERIAALVEERRMHEVDEAARNGVASAKHDELLQRLHRTEDALQATTKDYILGNPAEDIARHNIHTTAHACCLSDPGQPQHAPGLIFLEHFWYLQHMPACMFCAKTRSLKEHRDLRRKGLH